MDISVRVVSLLIALCVGKDIRVLAVSLLLAFVCWQGHGVYLSVRLISSSSL
jgi:hypothetical protein